MFDQQWDVWRCNVFMCLCHQQEQYVFVHDALLEALKCGDTSIPCVDFRRRYAELHKHNPNTDKERLLEEFQVYTCLC